MDDAREWLPELDPPPGGLAGVRARLEEAARSRDVRPPPEVRTRGGGDVGEQDLRARLSAAPGVAEVPGLAEVGAAAFAYATVLLDDDENLTRLGNPTGEAREKLRARIEELLGLRGEEP